MKIVYWEIINPRILNNDKQETCGRQGGKKHVVGRVAYQWFSMMNSGLRGLSLRSNWSLCCFLGQFAQEDYTLYSHSI